VRFAKASRGASQRQRNRAARSSTILNSQRSRIAERTVSSSTVIPRDTRCAAASKGMAPGVNACNGVADSRWITHVLLTRWETSERHMSSHARVRRQ